VRTETQRETGLQIVHLKRRLRPETDRGGLR